MIHFKKPRDRLMSEPHQRANGGKVRGSLAMEHVFAEQKQRMRLFIRTIGLAQAMVKIGMANIACNMRRLVGLERQAATG